jgi:hypothetical protein
VNPRDPWQVARWLVARAAEALEPRSLWLSQAGGGLSWWLSEGPDKPPRTVARPVYVTTVDTNDALVANDPGGWVYLARIAERIEPTLAAVR